MKVTYLLNIIQLIFPKICYTCDNVLVKGEEIICINCYLSIPKLSNKTIKHIYVEGKKYSLYTMYKFKKKSKIQLLIHKFKYKGKMDIGVFLGESLYIKLKKLNDISFIIPVPLNKKKEKLRGYNQSEIIAKGLKKLLKCEILTHVLMRHENKQSQTQKSRYDRFKEIEGVFRLNEKQILENKHIILLDDVYTTGATISECIKTLNVIKNIRISVVCVAS